VGFFQFDDMGRLISYFVLLIIRN